MISDDDAIDRLRATVAFAVDRIPWYRERRAAYALPTEVRDPGEALARLPLLLPDEFRAAPERFASRDAWPEAITYSSSTTSSIGRARWHSAAEAKAWADFHRSLAPEAERDGVTLVIHPYDHGHDLRMPGETHHVYMPFFVPWHSERILEILRDGWRGPGGVHRVREVIAFSPAHRIFTHWLAQRGIDPGSFDVRVLVGYGSIQPAPWRERLQREWGATYRDIYGLSEVKHGIAFDCLSCGAYHFGGPILPEVIDVETHSPIERGSGILVLTELHPWAELQLLLRYVTGDLVEIGRPCLLSPLGIRFRGRLAHSVGVARANGTRAWAGALEVGEVCAAQPEVAVSEIPWAAWARDVGAPRFRLEGDGEGAGRHRVRVTVELRAVPRLFPTWASGVAERLRAQLVSRLPDLAEAIATGEARLSIETVGPGELADPAKV